MRAVINGVQVRALGRKLLGHQFVNRAHKRLGKVTSANARLIGRYDHPERCFVDAANGGCGIRQQVKPTDVVQVADFFRYRAVAVNEYRAPQRARFRQDAPPKRKARVSRLLPPCQA